MDMFSLQKNIKVVYHFRRTHSGLSSFIFNIQSTAHTSYFPLGFFNQWLDLVMRLSKHMSHMDLLGIHPCFTPYKQEMQNQPWWRDYDKYRKYSYHCILHYGSMYTLKSKYLIIGTLSNVYPWEYPNNIN